MTDWITQLVEKLGYAGIVLLMFLENLFPPLPSEVIMPLAGFSAGQGELNIAGVIASGLAGTLLGAIFWYGIARWAGETRLRKWADRHGRWITLSGQDIERLEDWFRRHQRWAIPVGHVIPGIRTLISIPAGVFAVTLPAFLFLTALGAGLWTAALGIAGHMLGSRFEQVDRFLGPASTAIMVGILAYYIYRVITFKPAKS